MVEAWAGKSRRLKAGGFSVGPGIQVCSGLLRRGLGNPENQVGTSHSQCLEFSRHSVHSFNEMSSKPQVPERVTQNYIQKGNCRKAGGGEGDKGAKLELKRRRET